MQLIVDELDALGAEPRQRGHGGEIARHFLLQAVEHIETPALDDCLDLTGQILADAGQVRQVGAGGDHVAHVLGQVLHRAGGAAVGTYPEWVLALDLEQIRGLLEHGRDFGVLDRHRLARLLRAH